MVTHDGGGRTKEVGKSEFDNDITVWKGGAANWEMSIDEFRLIRKY
jgi:hypothetical protein